MYGNDDMLMLSGVQHFVFCPRQWALIHMDLQWAENSLTVEGSILHKRVDNPQLRQLNNNRITLRSMHIASSELGLYGVTDAVELIPTDDIVNSITHPRYSGRYIPFPIEYKRGHHKTNLCDTMQLICQVMCLEEMHGIQIDMAALFYWEVRRREEVTVTNTLRAEALSYARQMHETFASGILPLPDASPKCNRCSLAEICMPNISTLPSVASYLNNNLNA